MLSSSVQSVSDPDEYRTAIRPVNPDYIVTGRGRFAATVIKVDLHRLWLQKLVEALPRARFLESHRTVIYFPATSDSTATNQGIACGSNEIGIRPSGQPQWQTVSAGSRLCVISLEPEDLMQIGLALTGREIEVRPTTMFAAVDDGTITRLRRLHAAATHLAETSPETIANPRAARGLEESLAEAFVDCLTRGQPREEPAPAHKRSEIIRHFHRFAMEHTGEPLYLSDVCAAIGVSRRKLDLYCHEHLGTSPKRFLILRRMHLARRALRRGSPSRTSVTAIATAFGFWELGRFAVAYKSIFGESPSATLRADPDLDKTTPLGFEDRAR